MIRRLLVISISAAIILSFCVPVLASVQSIVDGVLETDYAYYLNEVLYTHDGDDRGFGLEHDLARANIRDEFLGFGLNTTLHPFEYQGTTYYNVVGVHQGRTRPEDIYIVGAHFDSVNNPGADDNASGMAGVLEAARVLSVYDFEATLVFVAFDREEQGLVGSSAYAQDHALDNILGMISLDMIAYNTNGLNGANIYGSSASSSIKNALQSAVLAYGNGLSATINGALDASDHAPFEWEGFQACLLIEQWGNPYYHQQADSVDTLDYIDYAFATNMVRSTVGFLAESAVLVPEPSLVVFFSIGILMLIPRRKR